MHPNQTSNLHYLLTQFGLPTNNTPTNHHIFSNHSQIQQLHMITPQMQEIDHPKPTSFSGNSTSDEADEQHLSVLNERKQRRMISNRESARRARMRKQRHMDELWSQVVWLRNENHQLIDKLNHVSESRDRAIEENARLKEEALELRQMLSDMRINSPYHVGFRELVDEPMQ